jgi:uncharacterized protein YacL
MQGRQTVLRVVFGLVTSLGGLAGFVAGFYFLRFFVGLSPLSLYATHAALVIFGLVLGILVATPASELVADGLDEALESLQKMSLGEVVLGALGLVVGLALAFFVSLAIQSLQFATVPVVGVWLGPLLILCSASLFGGLGALIGIRLSALPSARALFDAQASARALPILVDTSIVVDGRLGALLETGFLSGSLIVPQFVLGELQFLADAEDPLRRVRGRRGLEFLEELRAQVSFEVVDEVGEDKGADQKLIRLARNLPAAILTNDYNLQKVAAVQGIRVLNLNQLAAALKPTVLPGQLLQLSLQREGKESHQAVAYFEDGTMVVVEKGRVHIGRDVIAEVSSVMQTATGKMVFAKFRHLVDPAAPPTVEGSSEIPA